MQFKPRIWKSQSIVWSKPILNIDNLSTEWIDVMELLAELGKNNPETERSAVMELTTRWRKENGEFFWFFVFYSTLLYQPPSDSTLSEDAVMEPWTVATSAMDVRRSNRSARSHPPTRLYFICTWLDLIHLLGYISSALCYISSALG